MKFLLLALLFLPRFSFAASEKATDACLDGWKNAPFKHGAQPHEVIKPSVKVFGIGKKDYEDGPTQKPRLILIKPNVNVLGTTTFRLMNPNGWYCFKANVSVLGKISIIASCKAHIATSSDNGVNVLGADESDQGVTVHGTLRISRVGCAADGDEVPKVKSDD
jgi:hypothetical protein